MAHKFCLELSGVVGVPAHDRVHLAKQRVVLKLHESMQESVVLVDYIIAYAVSAYTVAGKQLVNRPSSAIGKTVVVGERAFRRSSGTSEHNALVSQSLELRDKHISDPLSVLFANVYLVYNEFYGTRLLDENTVGCLDLRISLNRVA